MAQPSGGRGTGQGGTTPFVQKGAGFITEPTLSSQAFTPENFTEEHRQFFRTAETFSRQQVEPQAESIEHKKPNLVVELMRKAGELGLFAAEVPEAYEGLGLDKVTSMLVAEGLAHVGSFAVTHGAHTGIGSLPLVYYGTEEQKKHFLPKLASGEWIGAYALSEQGSGSDAQGAKATAKLTADGKHYVLSGTKAWITNAAWAHVFTVFAQVDGDKFTAFLVERGTPGLSIGHEERKLGIRGSSTCQVILDDVKVPVANVLGEVGRGGKIAFNILNIGRYKLGAGTLGAAKYALGHGCVYAKERRQFKTPIAQFGLIQSKIAQSATLIYAGEAMSYRLAGGIDALSVTIDKKAPNFGKHAVKVIDQFAIEASILKIFGSETLGWVCDEMLQIHGGNGYTEDYPLERAVRDARINRIFEGTNEINRLIIPLTLFKRAMGGELPLMDYVAKVTSELESPERLPRRGEGPLGAEIWATELMRRAIVYVTSCAVNKYAVDIKDKQRVLGAIADCIIDLYAMDSAVARAHQVQAGGDPKAAAIHGALARLYCFDARPNILQRLRRIAMIMAEGAELDAMYDNLSRLDQRYRVPYVALQGEVAQRMLDDNGYKLSMG